jgi:hypothetical protein
MHNFYRNRNSIWDTIGEIVLFVIGLITVFFVTVIGIFSFVFMSIIGLLCAFKWVIFLGLLLWLIFF